MLMFLCQTDLSFWSIWFLHLLHSDRYKGRSEPHSAKKLQLDVESHPLHCTYFSEEKEELVSERGRREERVERERVALSKYPKHGVKRRPSSRKRNLWYLWFHQHD